MRSRPRRCPLPRELAERKAVRIFAPQPDLTAEGEMTNLTLFFFLLIRMIMSEAC